MFTANGFVTTSTVAASRRPPGAVTVSGVVEVLPLTRVHGAILVAAALGFAFDSFDTYIVSYTMPSIVREWDIDPVTNGLLTSAGMWGMLLGAIVWGPFSDRFGRRLAFSATLL